MRRLQWRIYCDTRIVHGLYHCRFSKSDVFWATVKYVVLGQWLEQFPNQDVSQGVQSFQDLLGFSHAESDRYLRTLRLDFFVIGSTLLTAMNFSELVQAVDSFGRRFGIDGVGDAFF